MTGLTDLRALLLDFDGTLVDSLPALRRAYDAFLGDHGIDSSSAEFEQLNGPTLAEIVATLKKRHSLQPPVEILLSRYLAQIDACAREHTRLFAGAREVVAWASSLEIQVAVVTSAPRAMVEGFLRRQDPPLPIACLVAGTDVAVGKPDPSCYRLALERLQIAPSQAIAVEDSSHGVRAARASGVCTIQVCRPGREEPGIEARVNDLHHLLEYLRRRSRS
jgi:HAD superfamily hydrolase (TIGR01509 family)